MSKDTSPPAPELPAVWPSAPLDTPPAPLDTPPAPLRRRTLLGSARMDAALGVPLGIAGGVLVAVVAVMRPMSCDGREMIGPGVAALVNLAISLAIGRRFRATGIGMGAASSVTRAALLWYFWYPSFSMVCGSGSSGGNGAGE